MKKLLSLLLASSVMAALPAYGADDAKGDPVVMKVNGEVVHQTEVDEAWKAVFQGHPTRPIESYPANVKDKFMREVATEHVLYQQALKENIQDLPETKAMLEKLKRQIVISELLREKTQNAVTEAKLKSAYDMHMKEAGGTDAQEYHARHILVKTKEAADDVEKRLKKGEGFDKLAKDLSDDKSSGASGGDLGWFTPDKMVPEFSGALTKLKKGEVSQPVKTEFGWHVIQLEDTRKVTPPPYDEVKETLRQEVGGKAVENYVKDVMKNITITNVDAQGHETPMAAAPETDTKVTGGDKGGSAE